MKLQVGNTYVTRNGRKRGTVEVYDANDDTAHVRWTDGTAEWVPGSGLYYDTPVGIDLIAESEPPAESTSRGGDVVGDFSAIDPDGTRQWVVSAGGDAYTCTVVATRDLRAAIVEQLSGDEASLQDYDAETLANLADRENWTYCSGGDVARWHTDFEDGWLDVRRYTGDAIASRLSQQGGTPSNAECELREELYEAECRINQLRTEVESLSTPTADRVSVPRDTLRIWRELVDLNPQDLAPRIDSYLKVTP